MEHCKKLYLSSEGLFSVLMSGCITANECQTISVELYQERLYTQSPSSKFPSPFWIATCALFTKAYYLSATDKFNALSSEILPFVFFAKHDSHGSVKDLYQDTWNENVGGARTVLLYVKEIVTIAESNLTSTRWVLKHTAARSLTGVVDAVSSSGEMSVADAKLIWPALVKAIGGKTWDGKEIVLFALVKFVQKGSGFWKANKDVSEEIIRVSLNVESTVKMLKFTLYSLDRSPPGKRGDKIQRIDSIPYEA